LTFFFLSNKPWCVCTVFDFFWGGGKVFGLFGFEVKYLTMPFETRENYKPDKGRTWCVVLKINIGLINIQNFLQVICN